MTQTAPLRAARTILGVALVMQGIGVLSQAKAGGTSLTTTMFMTWEWHEPTSYAIEQGLAWLGLGAGLVVATRGTKGLAVAMTGLLCASSLATWYQGGKPFPALTLPAHATRLALPLAVAFAFDPSVRGTRRVQHLEWILRISAALTFTAHGLEALRLHPRFVDLLIVASDRLVGIRLPQSGAEMTLRIIGLVDIVVAFAAVACKRVGIVAGYMALWGLVTAISRTIHSGWWGVTETAIRAANVGVPLALCVIASQGRSRPTPCGDARRCPPHRQTGSGEGTGASTSSPPDSV
ncbi:MAG: hypothetical protein B7733_21895 [Myxococcales bacterium FL481]|nr:MAG: hypothetical protein B7733_21895 [Myxococcales bacterium FL481]